MECLLNDTKKHLNESDRSRGFRPYLNAKGALSFYWTHISKNKQKVPGRWGWSKSGTLSNMRSQYLNALHWWCRSKKWPIGGHHVTFHGHENAYSRKSVGNPSNVLHATAASEIIWMQVTSKVCLRGRYWIMGFQFSSSWRVDPKKLPVLNNSIKW